MRLLFSKDERKILGNWAPSSDMPDHYDRAYCATDIQLRNSVLRRVSDGWAHAHAFEAPNDPDEKEAKTIARGGRNIGNAIRRYRRNAWQRHCEFIGCGAHARKTGFAPAWKTVAPNPRGITTKRILEREEADVGGCLNPNVGGDVHGFSIRNK